MRSLAAYAVLCSAFALGLTEAQGAQVDVTFYGNGTQSYHQYNAPYFLSQTTAGTGGTGFASGNAATGQLKAKIQAAPTSPQMTAIVEVQDTFTFHFTGPSIPVSASLYVHGVGHIPTGGNSLMLHTEIRRSGGPTGSFVRTWQASHNPSGLYAVPFNQDWSFEVTPTISFSVQPETPVTLSYFLRLDGNSGGISDFSNTASLWFSLPQGVTVDSTANFVQQVPEPTGVGAVLLGATLLLKRRQRA